MYKLSSFGALRLAYQHVRHVHYQSNFLSFLVLIFVQSCHHLKFSAEYVHIIRVANNLDRENRTTAVLPGSPH